MPHDVARSWHNSNFVFRRPHSFLRPIGQFGASLSVTPMLLGAGDVGSTRLVYAMVAGLIAIGIAFIALGVWLVRSTRSDPPVLAPLERMGDKDWRRQTDPATQRRTLDDVRPAGAEPLHLESSPPSLDAEFELPARPVESMNDLAALPAESNGDLAPPLADTRSSTPKGLERPDLLDLPDL